MVSKPENDSLFGLLPEQKSRFGSFGVSMVVNIAIGALLLLFAAAKVHEVKVEKYNQTTLVFTPPPPKPYIPPPPPRVHVIPPPPKVTPQPPKIKVEPPKPVVEPPKVNVVKVETKLPAVAPAPPKAVKPPPQPKVGLFQSSRPTTVANNQSAPTVKTGGFGDPNGAHPDPNANRPANIAAVGSFASAPGTQSGAGAARRGSVQGVAFGSGVANGVPGGRDRGTVASAGFGSGVVGGTGRPGGTGQVAQSGFGGTGIGSSGPRAAAAPQQAQSTPIVVISKPRAAYTAEAKQLHIEGDVTLQVRFTADGRVQVLQVVSGLGHGLDEQARAVAEGIRFKPATKDGHPVDEVTVIHVTFQLA
ncbi:energy transducer TonB [Silvibacterium dinghuense]|uniref:Energy transducer TonB n=1 Tax=Silvibacterium dinghuense TaxID=1560006 RepID=A0A4Q1SC91_9BACT|nr:energy transducer TonB [Silvibacterium dinghuense]RXS94430.1 energy transducer TonB [Silvibacterium dinghuense]GGH16158.1 hypothetical protein GCM10011586_37780 [Silvibacterium dinghuense]